MIKKVSSFKMFTKTSYFCELTLEKGVLAMEQGALHVDAVNGFGATLGTLLFANPDLVDQSLWDRYFALGPDVALFWKVLSTQFYEDDTSCRRLQDTPALWADLGVVVQRFASLDAWVHAEVYRRFQLSLRFVWIAATVGAGCGMVF